MGMVTVATAFAMVALAGFDGGRCGAETGEGFVVLEVGLAARSRCAGGVSASWSGSGTTVALVAGAGWYESWEETGWGLYGHLLTVLLELRIHGEHGVERISVDAFTLFVRITSRAREGGKAIIVLYLEVGCKLLGCAETTVGRYAELLHQRRRVMREEAVLSGKTVALQPELADVILDFMSETTVRARAVAAG